MKEIHKKSGKLHRNGTFAKGAEEFVKGAKPARTLLRCRSRSIILKQNKILEKREENGR